MQLTTFETDDQTVLLRKILDDELDLAFTVDAVPDPQIESVHLGNDPFVVVVPAGELPGPSVSPAEIDDHPVIGQPPTNVCQLLIDRRLEEVGVRPDYVFRSTDNGAVQGMVRSGMGWAVMPRLAVDPDDPGVDVLTLDPSIDPRGIQLTRRAGRSLPPAADHFTALAHGVAAEVFERDVSLVD